MNARTSPRRILLALALFGVLGALLLLAYLYVVHREEVRYARKLEEYEKGESEYGKLARTTGGDHLFVAPETDLSAFIGETGLEDVLWRQIGTLHGDGAVEVPVDDSVRRLGLSILGSSARQGSAFTLSATDPGGGSVSRDTAGAHVTTTRNGVIYVIDAPAPGSWTLRFSGEGSYQLAVKADADRSWGRVRFVEKGGRPGHEGWFPIAGRLSSGDVQNFEATFSGHVSEGPLIAVIDEFGVVLEKAEILSRDGDREREMEVLGRVRVPNRTFRFLLRAGPVQRVFDELFDPGRSQKAYSWTYRSKSPEADCAVVDFLLLTATGTREIDQVLWTCVQNASASGSSTTASATVMIFAADLPEPGGSLPFEAVNRLGNGPLELAPGDCERVAAILDGLDAEPAETPPPPSLQARCATSAASGAAARLHLLVTPAASGSAAPR